MFLFARKNILHGLKLWQYVFIDFMEFGTVLKYLKKYIRELNWKDRTYVLYGKAELI